MTTQRQQRLLRVTGWISTDSNCHQDREAQRGRPITVAVTTDGTLPQVFAYNADTWQLVQQQLPDWALQGGVLRVADTLSALLHRAHGLTTSASSVRRNMPAARMLHCLRGKCRCVGDSVTHHCALHQPQQLPEVTKGLQQLLMFSTEAVERWSHLSTDQRGALQSRATQRQTSAEAYKTAYYQQYSSLHRSRISVVKYRNGQRGMELVLWAVLHALRPSSSKGLNRWSPHWHRH